MYAVPHAAGTHSSSNPVGHDPLTGKETQTDPAVKTALVGMPSDLSKDGRGLVHTLFGASFFKPVL